MINKKRGKKMQSVSTVFLISLGFLALSVFFAGCGVTRPKQYVRKAANFQFIKKVAIIPFNNLTEDEYAGEKIKNALVMELLERGVFDVAEEGEVNQVVAGVFREMGFTEGDLVSLDIEAIQRISERLGVQDLFLGTVESYGISRTGGASRQRVSISLRLAEAKSGLTLWRASHSLKGSSLLRQIFGMEQKDELQISKDVAEALLDTLFGG